MEDGFAHQANIEYVYQWPWNPRKDTERFSSGY